MPYKEFLGKFPKIQYDMNRSLYGTKETVTDIFFRVKMIRDVINDISSYYTYNVQDGETPDSIATQIYGDPGAFWMILYANDIYDPQYDWPLSEQQFKNYIAEKYRNRIQTANVARVIVHDGGLGYSNGYIQFEGGTGSGANAWITVNDLGTIIGAQMLNSGTNYKSVDNVSANVANTINVDAVFAKANLSVILNPPSDTDIINYTLTTADHYEKVVSITNSHTRTTTEKRYIIDKNILTNGTMIVANTEGTFLQNEFVTANSGNTVLFSGIFVSANTGNTANGYVGNNLLVLANTTGDFTLNLTLRGQVTNASAMIMEAQFGEYDNYINLEAGTGGNTNTYVIDFYTLTETVKREAISIWEHETRLNDAKKEIKIILPEYYSSIQTQFENMSSFINTNPSISNTIFGNQVRRII